MEIPDNVFNIIQRTYNSEDEWKARYMGVWGCVLGYLEPQFKDTKMWEQKQNFGLPASKKGYYEYSPKELCDILRSRDKYFNLEHLQTLFSLLEELINELCPLVCNGSEIRADKFRKLKNFLSGVPPYNEFRILGISESDLNELGLAKETRNCFIHNASRVDKKWLNAFKNARKVDSTCQINEELPISFQQIEDWHQLIIKIVKKIEETIKNY